MATGRPLLISLAKYAAPIRQYSVFPLSAPWPLEQIVMYPQVTHLSTDCGEVSQGGRFKLATAKGAGCQAPGRTRTGDASITHIPGPLYLLSYKGIGGPEVHLRAEGKRSGSAEIRPHTPIVAYSILSESLTRES